MLKLIKHDIFKAQRASPQKKTTFKKRKNHKHVKAPTFAFFCLVIRVFNTEDERSRLQIVISFSTLKKPASCTCIIIKTWEIWLRENEIPPWLVAFWAYWEKCNSIFFFLKGAENKLEILWFLKCDLKLNFTFRVEKVFINLKLLKKLKNSNPWNKNKINFLFSLEISNKISSAKIYEHFKLPKLTGQSDFFIIFCSSKIFNLKSRFNKIILI